MKAQANTEISSSIFLDQVPAARKAIYVVVKNSSNKFIGIMRQLRKTLLARGYRVIKNPNQADYILQTNILKVAKMDDALSLEALVAGYGSSVVEFYNPLVNSLHKDLNYRVIADVQIDEWLGKGLKIKPRLATKNNTNINFFQTGRAQRQYQSYQARIVTSIDEVSSSCAQVLFRVERVLVETMK